MTANADLDYIKLHLSKTTVPWPQMVQRYGADYRKWPATSEWSLALTRLDSLYTATTPLTGTYWPNDTDLPQLKSLGFGFATVTVQPGDSATLNAHLDAAKAVGMKLILGLYPAPYAQAGSTWAITTEGQQSLAAMKAREADGTQMGLFVFNEPYNAMGLTATQLKTLYTTIKSAWPNAKVYHDLGLPSGWGNGGFSWTQTAPWDQTGVCDIAGVWYYPWDAGTSYYKDIALQRLAQDCAFVQNKMGATPVWLVPTHAAAGLTRFPPIDQFTDYMAAVKAALPAGALKSMYVWDNQYVDHLKLHPDYWPLCV